MYTNAQKGIPALAALPENARHQATTLVNHIAVNGAQTRADLMSSLGWSRTTISRAVTALIDRGILVEAIDATGARGRPTAALHLDASAGIVIGVDFGYRSIRVILATVDHAVLAADERVLDPEYGSDAGFDSARQMADLLLSQRSLGWEQIVGVGVALGGPVNETSNSVAHESLRRRWSGDLLDVAASYFPCAVYLGNDSRLACYSEMMWGAGRGYASFIYMKLHSGTGGCLVLNRKIVTGAIGAAGELGHMVVESPGNICRCGSRGCLETVVGVPAILATLAPPFPGGLTWSDVVARLGRGESAVVRAFDDAYRTVGRAAGSLANIFNPEAIILGGALSRAREGVELSVEESFKRHTLAANAGVVIEVGSLGRDAAALGAVGLVLTHGIA
ncbi:ROK family transcriptional regulator [Herbiconiux ginsengi]|uniref:Sugar kinase of the NBD/HSP70 family, may contain an N-terminal HTH domain n=1 Tax=Herbiconiux ginsengi TaxID=381665 RepID=A0A1H3MYX5_9MICO|nr:ROK family transcriptional regulator [Herbiconiux ginsengi]SDY81159.1 Sugar kinase of the NBD/HSP70 family, may contain an N-terminal HTH domain [Herbiconiux ginsengi]